MTAGREWADASRPDLLGRIPGLICPAIVAHRGASSSHPENTLIAFDAAVRAGADMIELDVRLTNDGVPIVMHDADVATTTDGSGLVHELSLRQINALTAGIWLGQPTRVPTLKAALETLLGRAAVEIDIKNSPTEPAYNRQETTAAQVVKLVRDLNFKAALVTSSNPETVEWVKTHAPQVTVGVEVEASEDLWQWLSYSANRGYTFLLPDAGGILRAGKDFIDQAHALGVQIDAWTVDDPETMSRLFAWGVDTIETNDPEMGVRIRDIARRSSAQSR